MASRSGDKRRLSCSRPSRTPAVRCALGSTRYRRWCMLREELHLPPDFEQFMEQLRLAEQQAWAAVNDARGINPPAAMPDILDPVAKVA